MLRRAKRQKVILQGVAFIAMAKAVQVKEKYVDKTPMEDYDFLRHRTFNRLFDGNKDICYEQLWLRNAPFICFVTYSDKKGGCVTRIM